MTDDELAAIDARARRRRIDVPLPRCTHDEERGHAPWCQDCDRDRQERIGPTFETHGRADVVALIAEVWRLRNERDAAFNRGVEAMREAAAKVCDRTAAEWMEKPSTQYSNDECFAADNAASGAAFEIRALKVTP